MAFARNGTDSLLTFMQVDRLLYSSIAFLVLMFGCRIILSLVVALINQVAKLPVLSFFNRSGGVLFALAKLAIITIIVVNLLTILPWAKGQEAMKESIVAQACIEMTPTLGDEMKAWME